MVDEFLKIFMFPFYKLNLERVKLVDANLENEGKKYWEFVGKFRLKTANGLLDPAWVEQKQEILDEISGGHEWFTRLYRKKYTKKVDGDKWSFNYAFDLSPGNVVDFKIEGDELVVYFRGYGCF